MPQNIPRRNPRENTRDFVIKKDESEEETARRLGKALARASGDADETGYISPYRQRQKYLAQQEASGALPKFIGMKRESARAREQLVAIDKKVKENKKR